ncbi:MAG: T9SS type A sorting domain-containing protein [Flavobacteriales bacterium]
MKLSTILFAFACSAFCNLLHGQCDDRYRNFLFQDFVKTADVHYGSNINMEGNMEELMMDVYVPEGDVATDRAVIIICHGGYFLAGDKAASDVVPMCQDFAKMGYVVASINYRMGVAFTPPLEGPYGLAVARAVQDLRAAIRWFRKDATEGGNQYGIDPNQIYAGGASAGGFMTLHHAFMDEEEIPDFMDMTAEGLEGGLEGQSGNPGYSSDVNAIFSVSGALGDSAWIDVSDTTPVCLFHGDNDGTVTFDSDMFVLFGIMDVTEIDGSNSLHQKLDELGLQHCFEVNEGLGHVPYQGNPAVYDTTISIISNFLSHFICGADWDCGYREITTGVSENENSDFNLYPNPANQSFIILQSVRGPASKCTVMDATGRTVLQLQNSNITEVNIENLAAGCYQVLLEGNDWREVSKLIVEK